MSDKIDDGGPAFPTDNEAQTGPNTYHWTGMTLRDWFAGQALAGALANPNRSDEINACGLYMVADAMIAARKGSADDE